jgi:hypothetical protein
MDDIAAIFGSQPLLRFSRRATNRQLHEESRINEAPAIEPRERGLSEHVPSPLIALQDRVRALAIGGAPAWSRRLKRIHDLTTAAEDNLRLEWIELARTRRRDAARFAADWKRRAERVSFAEVNDLIDRHNHYFPAEANLAMDVHTRDFVGFGGGDYRLKHLGAAWILERFPADLAAASGGIFGA